MNSVEMVHNSIPLRFLNRELALKQYDPALVNLLEDNISKTDAYADDLVDVFNRLPSREGWNMFELALARGIEAVESPPEELRALFREIDRVPDWVDMAQINRGSVAYWRPGLLMGVAMRCASLAAGYRSAAAVKPLVFTGRFVERAEQRATETAKWALTASAPGGMERFHDGFKYTARVRLVHAFVRSRLAKLPEWQFDAWGQPINLTDTTYGISGEFCSIAIKAVEKCGVYYSDREIEDMYAMWRYIGFVLGIPEELLMRDESHALTQMEIKELTDTPADKDSRELVKALIENGGDLRSQLPSFMRSFVSDKAVDNFLYGLVRFFAGDEVADDLGIPDNAWKHSMRFMRPAIVLKDRARHLLPGTDLQTTEKCLAEMREVLSRHDSTPDLASTNELRNAIQKNRAKFS